MVAPVSGGYPTRQLPSKLTREQVRAELAAAKRSGDVVAHGELGLKQRELYPSAFPAQESQAGLTRAAVIADLREAMRTGDFVASGENTAQHKELHPNRYPKN